MGGYIDGQQFESNALNVMDLATGLFILIRICKKSTQHGGLQFKNEWLLACYLIQCKAFMTMVWSLQGIEFQGMLQANGVEEVSTMINSSEKMQYVKDCIKPSHIEKDYMSYIITSSRKYY